MVVELYKYMELSTEFSASAPYVLIGTGAFIILVGSLACCCTLKGQPLLLYIVSNQMQFCKISGFHGGDYEECRLLGCYAVWLL
jgi:hypothetical protein